MEKTRRKRRGFNFVPIIGIIGFAVVLVIIIFLVKRYAPSRHILPLTEFYPVTEGEILVVMQDEVMEQRGIFIEDRVYLEYNQVTACLNKRFYWDYNENLLLYTTPTSVIKVIPGEHNYTVNKNKKKTDYEVVKLNGDKVYLALDFIELYTDLSYKIYDKPDRVVITYKYGQKLLFTETKKKVAVRKKAGIKSDIVSKVAKGSKLQCIDENAESVNGFLHIITEDGVKGYISVKATKTPFEEKMKSNTGFRKEKYSHISKDYKINLVWHQVYNQDANNQLSSLLEKTKGINTICPTWFRILDTEGSISSIASESYVEKAHSLGIEVWALTTDVDTDIDMHEIFSYTSKREKLEKELLAQAIKYDLDGINLDFERISKDTAASYLQFIREMSIKCRKNDIVLSIDNYVPTEYTAYYDRKEQAAVADYIMTMAYDEHYAGGGESGSVASIGYVDLAIDRSLEEIPAKQLLLGIPFYTRLWKEVTQQDGTLKVTAESYGMVSSWNRMKDVNVTPEWDDETEQYYGEYESDGAVYKMWLEDENSIEKKVERAYENELAGTAAWKLGMEKKEVWSVIQKYMN